MKRKSLFRLSADCVRRRCCLCRAKPLFLCVCCGGLGFLLFSLSALQRSWSEGVTTTDGFDWSQFKTIFGNHSAGRVNVTHLRHCDRLFDVQRSDYAGWLREVARRRSTFEDPKRLDVSCEAIRKRWRFADEPLSEVERRFPIAFARTVYRDYFMLEQMLAAEYQPQNFYCYALDAKASGAFKRRVRALASCFPDALNVVVPAVEYSVFSNGKNVTRSHLSCVFELLRLAEKRRRAAGDGKSSPTWDYVVLLQNHDIPLKSNRQMVEIMKILNGTNDISTHKVVPISLKPIRTVGSAVDDWTFQSLQLYVNAEDNDRMAFVNRSTETVTRKARRLRHTKSLVSVALSRDAAVFLRDRLRLRRYIDRLERSAYGMDELFLSTLNSNLPDFPGGFTRECFEKYNRTASNVVRYVRWKGGGRCRSGKYRHNNCIFGVEDLAASFEEVLHMYINKMMPSFDYTAVFCWLRHYKAESPTWSAVNRHFYENLPHVRYNRLRWSGQLETKGFDCL